MSKAERATLLEKQHLKECEESDYQILEGLFTARVSVDDVDDSYEAGASVDSRHRHPFRRETATELPPSKPTAGSVLIAAWDSSNTIGPAVNAFQAKNARSWIRNTSMVQQQLYDSPAVPQLVIREFLNPPYESTKRLFKNSSESLHKNSSTDADYAAHPYRFIKQSLNDTTTAMTGSYIIDTPSWTAASSLDVVDVQSQPQALATTRLEGCVSLSGGSGMNISVCYQPLRTSSVGASDERRTTDKDSPFTMSQVRPTLQAMQLKKQFSLDQGKQQQPIPPTLTSTTALAPSSAASPKLQAPSKHTTSITADTVLPLLVPPKLISSMKPPLTSKLETNTIQESSLNTEESKNGDQSAAASSTNAVMMLQFSTDLVQDEIAKLSSNIKSSIESEKDPPYNETMC